MIEQRAFEQLIGAQFGPYHLKQLVAVDYHTPLFLAHVEKSSGTCLVRLLTDSTPLHSSKRDEYLARFEQKAGQLAALHHPCLLPVIDYGVERDTPFLVMPQIAMQSLRNWLANNGPMDALAAGHCLDQLCGALVFAHRHGILHESLTIDCIYLQPDGRLLLANLGLISLLDLQRDDKHADLDARAGEGSAPEQLTGKPVGPFTDVYALGAVLYHLLTGEPAFSGYTAQELASQHLYASILPPNRWRADLPPGLSSIFARAMAKNPKQRFQQAGALATAYHRTINPDVRNQLASIFVSTPAGSVQQPFVPETPWAKEQHTDLEANTRQEPDTDKPTVVDGYDSSRHSQPARSLLVEGVEDLSDNPTLKRIRALPGQATLPLTPEDLSDKPTLPRVATPPGQKTGSSTLQNLPDTNTDTGNDLQAALPRKTGRRNIVITIVPVLIVAAAAAVLLFSRQPVGQRNLFGNPQFLLGMCIVLSIAFTVGFNIISRVSLSATKHESAYTILWQLFCALLVPFFLPFDRFSIDASARVLLLFALSVVLWALVDAFLFSSFKYEEASVLSAIFPLNYVFTFAVSVVFLHSAIHSTIVIGFLIIMTASLLIGLHYMRVRPSKGIIFALLYSLFQGVALGFNSEVVKSFSIPPYMFAAFLFPAIANLFIFLRPKVSELRYELRVQWKKILLNAAVMDISFFFLLKAFELGNVPQVVALSASSTLLTALAGIVILKEDSHVALKILAAVLATLGIILVQL